MSCSIWTHLFKQQNELMICNFITRNEVVTRNYLFSREKKKRKRKKDDLWIHGRGKKMIIMWGYYWLFQAELITAFCSLWMMNTCRKSYIFKQALCCVVRRCMQKVNHIYKSLPLLPASVLFPSWVIQAFKQIPYTCLKEGSLPSVLPIGFSFFCQVSVQNPACSISLWNELKV